MFCKYLYGLDRTQIINIYYKYYKIFIVNIVVNAMKIFNKTL